MATQKMTLSQLGGWSNEQAREYLESIRWASGAACPRCGDTAVTKLQGKSTRPGVYKCKGCRKPFTVTVGTIMERGHVELRHWVMAFFLMCSSKKGISALQLQRQLGIGSYKTAWFFCHRVREAMTQQPLAGLLSGIVEVDEAYIGGKPRNKGLRFNNKRGAGTPKAPVMVLVERGGNARALALQKVTPKNLKNAIRENVERSATIMSDEHPFYQGIGKEYAGGHHTTKHLAGEYLRGEVHSNTAESFFAIVKRSVNGTHHHWSKQHLARYMNERAFVWNHRKATDEERTISAIRAIEGKRLLYRDTQPPA